MKRYDLEERLISFSVRIIHLTGKLKHLYTGRYLSGQIIRSGTSAALNYGEAQSAESRKDFIHKMKIVQKELRETHIALRIIKQAGLINEPNQLTTLVSESNELISIFTKSVETARKNMDNQSKINNR